MDKEIEHQVDKLVSEFMSKRKKYGLDRSFEEAEAKIKFITDLFEKKIRELR